MKGGSLVLLRTQQFKVDLTDALQGVFELVVVTQPLLDNRFLFGTKTDLLGAAAGITNRQDPNGMAISVGTHGTAGAMTNDAAEQRATDDLGGKREGGGEFGALAEGGFFYHLYR